MSKQIKDKENEFFAELDAQSSRAGKEHSSSCVFLAFYFILIYLVLVLAFWQIGAITHQTNRGLADLYQAQSLTDVRAALVERFGSFKGWQVPSIEELRRNATDSVNNAVQEKIKEQTSAITDQLTNQAETAVEGQLPDQTTP